MILGVMYREGAALPGDDTRAADLFGKACRWENGSACTRLAEMYEEVPALRDSEKARQLYRQGCELGDAEACAHLKAP
jgi:TPR repeat protein